MPPRPYEQSLCVVTGANGFIGSHLVRTLKEQGATVRALVRRSSDLWLLEGCTEELVYGDVLDRASLEAAFDGADYLFHVAGIVKALSEDTFHRVNGGGTQNVCEVALSAAPGLKRLVHVSSIAVAGPSAPGVPRTEVDEPAPVSVYGVSKLAGERAVRGVSDRLPVSIIRPTIVYGPGDTGTLELFNALKRHLKVVITGGARLLNYVYVSDLVDGILLAGQHERAVGETFFISHPEPASYQDFQERILKAMGTWAVRVPFPAALMPTAGRIADWWSRRRGQPSIFGTSKVAEALPMQWLCSVDKAYDDLGFRARYGLTEGLSLQTQWYKAHHLI